MHFYHGHETLTIFGWILRAVITFLVIVISAKFMGQRAISQLGLLDFVIALMLGNIIAHPLSDPTIGMKGSIITTLTTVILYICSVGLGLKFPSFRKLTESEPFPVIKNGEIYYGGLKKARISIDHLLAELRKEKVDDVKKVALALWESDGKLSIFLEPQFQPVTPIAWDLKPDSFELPKIIIKEGKIIFDVLERINKKPEWLITTLKVQHLKLEEVLLATIDKKNNLKVFLYK